MNRHLAVCFTVAALLAATPNSHSAAARPSGKARLVVAWSSGQASGFVAALRSRPPFALQPPLATDRNVVLHAAQGRVFVLNRDRATVLDLDPDSWTVRRSYPLGLGGVPEDLAVTGPRTAYVTREGNARLQQLDLRTGMVTGGADLTPFADEDGVVHPGMMALHGRRLFIQLRRPEALGPGRGSPYGYLAVVNAKTGRLIDADRRTPGVQAISLEGTAPRLRMQVVPQTKRLYVSATGRFHDAGGLEAINLTTLRSEGLVIREEDGMVGADLGPFIFTTPTSGYLLFSTDLTLSSHLLPFSLEHGVPPGPQLHVSVDYFVPTLAHDPRSRLLFLPDGAPEQQGLFVFDARTGEKLTPNPIPVSGVPTDLLLAP